MLLPFHRAADGFGPSALLEFVLLRLSGVLSGISGGGQVSSRRALYTTDETSATS